MRLMRKRSMESPLGSPAPGSPAPPAEPPATEKADGNVIKEQSNTTPYVDEPDKGGERRLDLMSGVVDISAELATIQTAEKRTMNSATVNTGGQEDDVEQKEDITGGAMLPALANDSSLATRPSLESFQPRPTHIRPQSSFGMLETSFDLGGSLGMGLRDSMGSIQLGEMRSALDRLMDDVKGSSGPSTKKPNARPPNRVELMTEGIKAGQFSANTSSNIEDDSMRTETDMDISMNDFRSAPIVQPAATAPPPIQRAATDSIVYTAPSFRSPVEEELAPIAPPQTKDAIRAREQLILEKRRQARRRDQEESVDYYTPPRPMSMPPSSGRPSRRRSRSTGDAGALTKSDLLLDIGISDTEEELLADSISKELRRLDPEHRQGVSCIRESQNMISLNTIWVTEIPGPRTRGYFCLGRR